MDCFITELKGTTTNSSILKLGESRIYISETTLSNTSKTRVRIRSSKDLTLKSIGGNFLNSQGVNIGDSVSIIHNLWSYLYTEDSVEYISVPNKNAITHLKLYDCTIYAEQWQSCPEFAAIDAEEGYNSKFITSFAYLNGISLVSAGIQFSGYNFKAASNIHGDFSELDNSFGFTYFAVPSGSNISGDIISFINRYSDRLTYINCRNSKQIIGTIDDIDNIVITTVSVNGTSVTGIIDNLAQHQVDLGRTSGTLTVRCENTNVMYFDTVSQQYKPVPVKADITFTNERYSISVS